MWDNPLPWDAKETTTILLETSGINPQFYNIEVGDTVVWVNDDTRSHNVTADDGSFDSGAIAPGDSFSFTFNEEGTFSFSEPDGSVLFSGSITV